MSDIKEYIKMRNNGKYDLQWFYKYFVDNGGARIDFESFNQSLQFYGLGDILEGLDKKFELKGSVHLPLKAGQKVLGDFIKIIE